MTGSRDIQNGWILSRQNSYMLEVQIPVVHMLTTSPHYAAQLQAHITLLTYLIMHKSGLNSRAWRYKLYNHYFHSLFIGIVQLLVFLSYWHLLMTSHKLYRISLPIRLTMIFSMEILEKNNDECILILVIYWKETGLLHTKISNHKQWCHISWFGSKFHYLTIKMLYNRCTGIYKFGNKTYPRHIRRKSNLGHIFRGKKCVLRTGKYGNY